jgi:hypothetical protein
MDYTWVTVAVDCRKVPLAPLNRIDAGNFDGFAIDYSWNPARIQLLGAYCGLLQDHVVHTIVVVEGCPFAN